jgi:hypothetical protein
LYELNSDLSNYTICSLPIFTETIPLKRNLHEIFYINRFLNPMLNSANLKDTAVSVIQRCKIKL